MRALRGRAGIRGFHARSMCARIAHMAAVDGVALGARIREARQRSYMSQAELGGRIGLDRTAVNKIECGTRKVTALELADIAEVMDVRLSSFFEDPVPALVSHRSSGGLEVVDSMIDGLLEDIAHEVEFVASLGVDALGFDGTEVPEEAGISRDPDLADPESLARSARELMGCSETQPILDISAAVAQVGLLAFSRDLGEDAADAGTIQLRRGAVCLINSNMKVGRRRLALAHELGHYLIGDAYAIDWRVVRDMQEGVIESRLDRFARSVLLPSAAITHQWQEQVSMRGERRAAVFLTSEFRTDMATLARRLVELGVADADTGERVRQFRTTRADIVEMELHVPLEELEGTTVARPFALAVLALVRDERISRERALDLLQGTFQESDLPSRRQRRPDEIWTYVS